MRPLLVHLFLVLLILPKPAVAQETKAKLPIPTREALEQSDQVVRKLHAAEFAKTTSAARLDLAKTLLQQGKEIDDSPSDRFALWRQSATLAILAGDMPLAWKAVDELGNSFAGSPWELKASIFEFGAAKGTPADLTKLSQAAIATFEQARTLDPDSAVRLLDIARTSAQKAKDKTAIALVETRAKDFEKVRHELEEGKQTLAALKAAPTDPAANLKAGRFLCFSRGDWSGGLPLLAKGSDADMAALAKKDLARPDDVKGQLEVGDGWFAQSSKATPSAKVHVLARACAWYRAATPNLVGFTKIRIEKRLSELASVPVVPLGDRATPSDTSPGTPTASPLPTGSAAWTVLFRSSDPSIWGTNVRRGPDDFAVPFAKAPQTTRYLKLTHLASKEYVIIEASRAQLGARSGQGRYRWNGTSENRWAARHLGVCDLNCAVFYLNARGSINIDYFPEKTLNGFGGFVLGRPGWGFGNRCAIDDIQGFSWGMDKIFDSAAFEIAVTPGPLSAVEAKSFLSDDLTKLAGFGGIAPVADTGDWIKLFRSSDPAHWGLVDRSAKDDFALDLRKVPAGIRYLKLTDTTTSDFVVVETTKQALFSYDVEVSEPGPIVWRGDAVSYLKGAHLGICDRKRNVGGQDVSLTTGTPNGNFSGWGFGHPVSTAGQGFCWAGRTVPVTVFEIAVKSSPLTAAEKGKLLPAGR